MLFFLTRNINDGYLGFEDWNFFKIPEQLYLNKFTTYVGFTEAGFFSSDYFSLMPWFFYIWQVITVCVFVKLWAGCLRSSIMAVAV